MVSGKIESSEMHEVRVIFSWNSSERSVKHLVPSGWRAWVGSGFGLRASGFGLRASGFGLGASACGLGVGSGLGFVSPAGARRS